MRREMLRMLVTGGPPNFGGGFALDGKKFDGI
jgi:hypothetical protein